MSRAVRTVLVDDSDDVLTLLTFALEREPDFDVVGRATDGAAGIRAVREHSPELVLLDVSMPTMDGIEALGAIREASPDAVVVMLSAFTGFSDASQQCLQLGAHGYVEKGGGLSRMIGRLRSILEEQALAV